MNVRIGCQPLEYISLKVDAVYKRLVFRRNVLKEMSKLCCLDATSISLYSQSGANASDEVKSSEAPAALVQKSFVSRETFFSLQSE